MDKIEEIARAIYGSQGYPSWEALSTEHREPFHTMARAAYEVMTSGDGVDAEEIADACAKATTDWLNEIGATIPPRTKSNLNLIPIVRAVLQRGSLDGQS